jgi:hypothetical protein
MRYWEKLRSDEGAHFDHEIRLDAAKLPPIVTWGTSPEDVVSISGFVPDPDQIADEAKRLSKHRALKYMGLTAARRSPTSSSTASSSAPAPTAASRICARRRSRRRQDRQRPRQRDDRAGLGHREGAGGSRRPRQDLHQGRLRVARAGLLDVPAP